jgi:hypothetical protein
MKTGLRLRAIGLSAVGLAAAAEIWVSCELAMVWLDR